MKDKILFIDDEQANLDGFYYTFNKEFDITLALSAFEAIEILQDNQFKVIISDHRMKGITGIEFLSSYKGLFHEAVLIVLTAYSETEDLIDAINKAAIYRYILKPWDTKDLRITIQSAIQTFDLKSKNHLLIQQLEEKNKALLAALEKAKESDFIKLTFINNISHEIRTPMNGILGFSDLLKNVDLPESFEKYINVIQKSTQQLLNIIDGILEFSVLMNENFKIKNNMFAVNEILRELYNNYKYLENENIKFILKPESNSFMMISDKEKIKTVLSKLIDNSFKYTANGFVELGYNIPEEEKDVVTFYVKDTGIGIPESLKDRLFESFTKMDIVNKKYNEGNGLGLSVAKIITQKMEGEIWYECIQGSYTCFYCKFPLNKKIKVL